MLDNWSSRSFYKLAISFAGTVGKSRAESAFRRRLDIQTWFGNPVNVIIFVISLFAFIMLILVILLIYKMNPRLRNWIKGLCKKKPVVVEKETLERDWTRYVERK